LCQRVTIFSLFLCPPRFELPSEEFWWSPKRSLELGWIDLVLTILLLWSYPELRYGCLPFRVNFSISYSISNFLFVSMFTASVVYLIDSIVACFSRSKFAISYLSNSISLSLRWYCCSTSYLFWELASISLVYLIFISSKCLISGSSASMCS